MNNKMRKHISEKMMLICLMAFFALMLALAVQPVAASPSAQAATGTPTPTVTGTLTVTATPTATGTGATTTATSIATMAPPVSTGTPSALVPVTGADLTQPPINPMRLLMEIGIGILGLAMLIYGLSAYLKKR